MPATMKITSKNFAGKLCVQSLHGLRVVDVDELDQMRPAASSHGGASPRAGCLPLGRNHRPAMRGE